VADEPFTSSTGGSTTRRLRRAGVVLVGVLSLLAVIGCESTAADRTSVISLVNESRAANGLAPLRENVQLDVKADGWAQYLRDLCDLKHSKLSDGAPSEWQKLGENVGYGGDIGQVHTAYMNSAGHRANILDPSFNSIGSAAVWGVCDGQRRVFTVQVFMKS
jgi:uncharacterized protein YkwD